MSNKLAEVARHAKSLNWMKRSRAKRGGLTKARGYCCAWAAECLAHTFDPNLGPNARHRNRDFLYTYESADEWGRALRKGADSDKGAWLGYGEVGKLRPGDMIFWIQGVNGYRYYNGHVAIVVSVNSRGRVTVSENSSSRGIGTHGIDADALSTMAGVMRWNVGERELLLQRADSNDAIPFWMEGDTAVCGVRAVVELLGWNVNAEHLKKQGKLYAYKR